MNFTCIRKEEKSGWEGISWGKRVQWWGVSECNRNALLANKVTFCVLQHLLPIQRKSLHTRPVLCRKFMEKEAFCLIPDTLEHDFRGILTSCLSSNGLRQVSPRTSKYGL